MVRPDSKGRITLGHLADGVSGFSIKKDKGKIILEPYAEIPLHEKWLFDNKVALQKVKQGLKEAGLGEVTERDGFSQYIDDEWDDK